MVACLATTSQGYNKSVAYCITKKKKKQTPALSNIKIKVVPKARSGFGSSAVI